MPKLSVYREVPVGKGRVAPRESIWTRSKLWGGYEWILLTRHVDRLDQKITAEEFFGKRYKSFSSVFLCTCSSLIGFLGLITGFSLAPACAYDENDETLCEVGIGAFATAAGALAIPAVMYGRHRYKLAHGKCLLWKEKKRILEVFRDQLDKKGEASELKELFFNPIVPLSLKEELAISSSLPQLFEAAKDTNSSEQEYLASFMHKDDLVSLYFLIRPEQFDGESVLRGLSQFQSFFVKNPHIFDYFLGKVSRSLLVKVEMKNAIREIQNLQEEEGSALMSVQIGSETFSLTRRKLEQFPELMRMLQTSDTSESCSDSDSVSDSQPDAALAFPFRMGQDTAQIIALFTFIDTGKMDCKDFPSLLQIAKSFDKKLTDACILSYFKGIRREETDVKEEAYRNVIGLFTGESMPPGLVKAIEKEFLYVEAEAAVRWLVFAKKESQELFDQLQHLPHKINQELFEFVYYEKPANLWKALKKQLKRSCEKSTDPIRFMEAYSDYPKVFRILADFLIQSEDYIVAVWELAALHEDVVIKEKIARKLGENPKLAEQWPFLEFPDELKMLMEH